MQYMQSYRSYDRPVHAMLRHRALQLQVVDAVMHVLLEPEKAGYMVFLERDGTLQRVAFPNQCWTRLKSL